MKVMVSIRPRWLRWRQSISVAPTPSRLRDKILVKLQHSGNSSRVKTFETFAVSGQFAKVITMQTRGVRHASNLVRSQFESTNPTSNPTSNPRIQLRIHESSFESTNPVSNPRIQFQIHESSFESSNPNPYIIGFSSGFFRLLSSSTWNQRTIVQTIVSVARYRAFRFVDFVVSFVSSYCLSAVWTVFGGNSKVFCCYEWSLVMPTRDYTRNYILALRFSDRCFAALSAFASGDLAVYRLFLRSSFVSLEGFPQLVLWERSWPHLGLWASGFPQLELSEKLWACYLVFRVNYL